MDAIITQSIRKRFLAFLNALCFVISFNHYFFTGNTFGSGSVFNFILLVCAFSLIMLAEKAVPVSKASAFIFSTAASLSIVFGRVMLHTNDLTTAFSTIRNCILTVVSVWSFSIIIGCAAIVILSMIMNVHIENAAAAKLQPLSRAQTTTVFFVMWSLIFLFWLPAWLAYYPGIFSYDIGSQTSQALGLTPYTKFHPPLHTFFWQMCIAAADYIGVERICVYELVQMAILSAALAGEITFIIRRRAPAWLIVASFLFLAVNPVIAVFSLVTAKDVIFGALFAVITMQLCTLVTNPDEFLTSHFRQILFITVCILACLFRNNCVHALIMSAPLCAMIAVKRRTNILVLFTASILCFVLINGYIYDKFDIKPGDPKEALSIPIQQIARVANIHRGEISPEVRARIDHFIPFDKAAERYNPRWADPVKDHFRTNNYIADKGEFFTLWLDLLKSYPTDFANAFLTLNLPYWYPDSLTPDPFSKRMYIETYAWKHTAYSFKRLSRLPKLLSIYEAAADFSAFKNIPFVSFLMSPSAPLWLILTSLLMLHIRHRRTAAAAFIPSLMLWATYIAGPVSNFRYIFPIFALYPLFAALVFYPKHMNINQRTTVNPETVRQDASNSDSADNLHTPERW